MRKIFINLSLTQLRKNKKLKNNVDINKTNLFEETNKIVKNLNENNTNLLCPIDEEQIKNNLTIAQNNKYDNI